ncbi:MAG: LysR family transcriptional regulator, partial [Betaproteobacteria bacterium]
MAAPCRNGVRHHRHAAARAVRCLEDAIGKPLFVRGARALSLTPEGRQLYA